MTDAPRDLAFPGIGSLAAGAFDAAMKSVWEFAGGFLTATFDLIDKFTTPNLDPSTGPISTVLPTVGWIAAAIASLLVFVQIGWGAVTRGVGLAKLLVGAGQYVLVTACGYAVLVAAVTAATGLTHGILSSGLGVDTWAGINGTNNGPLLAAVQSYTGVQLGMVAITCVIPAAAGYLVEAMVRAAALLILAATLPILAAGLLSEKTASWFWKGLRWMIALLMLQPATALVISIGFNIASGAAGGAPGTGDIAQGLGSLLIGGITLLVSLVCPFALFKLLAFVDPSTPSGSAVRSGMAGGGQVPHGVVGGGKGAGSSGQAAGEAATSGRFSAALGKAGPYGAAAVGALKVAHAVGQRTVGAADHVLSAAGAGHHGGGTSAVPMSPVGKSTGRPGGSGNPSTGAAALTGGDQPTARTGQAARPVPPPPLREPHPMTGIRPAPTPPPDPHVAELVDAEKDYS